MVRDTGRWHGRRQSWSRPVFPGTREKRYDILRVFLRQRTRHLMNVLSNARAGTERRAVVHEDPHGMRNGVNQSMSGLSLRPERVLAIDSVRP
jgi:hypothetical protein